MPPSIALDRADEKRDGIFDEEIVENVEIRKGRIIVKRTVVFMPPVSPCRKKDVIKKKKKIPPDGENRNEISKEIEGNKIEENVAATTPSPIPVINLIFVHGSCASSSQFDALIRTLGERVTNPIAEENPIRPHGTNPMPKKQPFGVICHLFDSLGCGQSFHDPSDYNAFSDEEMAKDLEEIFRSSCCTGIEAEKSSSLRNGTETTNEGVYLVGHSYGTSQILKLIPNLTPSERASLKGIVLISGALKEEGISDGGHWIFGLPVLLLKLLQPKLTSVFVEAAYHPSTSIVNGIDLKTEAVKFCNNNDMNICKAFYQQTKWATTEDAKKLTIPALVIQGDDDMLVPLHCAEHLAESLPNSKLEIISNTRHQVFQERPDAVCDILWNFIHGKED